MGIFDKLFSKRNQVEDDGGKTGLTREQFANTAYVKNIVQKYQKKATLLKPQTSSEPLGPEFSKFGDFQI